MTSGLDAYALFSTMISRMYHDIQKIERTEMEKYGLKGPHAQCLAVLSQYPEGITAAQLGEICERDKAAISRTVSELERAGLLERRDANGIHYRMPLVLTERGHAVADRVRYLGVKAVEQASEGLEDGARSTIFQVLDLIAENLHMIGRAGLCV